MNKRMMLALGLVLLLTFGAGSSFSQTKTQIILTGEAGKSSEGFLDFFEMDSLGKVVVNGAQGKLRYNLSGPSFKFSFNGRKLLPGLDYTLIRSREPEITWPNRYEVLGKATADSYGNLTITDSYKFGMDLLAAKFLLIPSKFVPDNHADPNASIPVRYASKFLVGQGAISFEDTTSDLKCGASLRPEVLGLPGASSFDLLGPQTGDKAVDFTLWGIEGPETLTAGNKSQPLTQYTLSELLKTKPVLLVFGAFT